MKVEESLNVTFNKSPLTKLSALVDDDVGKEEAIRNNTKVVNINNGEDVSIEVDEVVNIKESKNHPLDQVIGNLNQRTLRSQAQNHSNFFCFISTIEPKNVNEALKDESWVDLFPLAMSQSVIGTKWVFRNKLDENGIVSRNKAMLVAQGYNQQEGIDYDERYALVARLEDSKPTKTPMSTEIKFTKDDEDDSVNSSNYRENPNTTHIEAIKRIFRKQTALIISTTEAKYVSAGKACQQALWMKQALIDYDIHLGDIPIMCDNKGAIE
ncbi:retrovirus-related pol polyprotein from transposon TNT 1-94 [Tanacetum coccineum]|uniref:Retrovirus-related pol polyprotein from transposon TNT 1-94 n=1 Tax=Tanacetum coccineum TaxID=301880 RepID=A0ABQ5CF95_9ASTR